MTLTWEDIKIWCDELNAWIIELGAEEEFKVAHPYGPFPLSPDPEKDDLEEDRDVLGYLTLWMCLERKVAPPKGLHNRMILSEKFKGPWQILYTRLLEDIKNKKEVPPHIKSIFELAG